MYSDDHSGKDMTLAAFQKDEVQPGHSRSLKADQRPRPTVREGRCRRVLDHAMLYDNGEEPAQLLAPHRKQATAWKGASK